MREHALLILSDSHGHTRNLRTALASQLHLPETVLFLGDGLRDLGCLGLEDKGIPLLAVKGNCDSFSYPEPDDPDERLLTVGNVRICVSLNKMRIILLPFIIFMCRALYQSAHISFPKALKEGIISLF